MDITPLSNMPMGLAYLAAYLDKNDIDVRFMDMQISKKKHLHKLISEWQPDYIGFSLNEGMFTLDIDWKPDMNKIINFIRERVPNVTFIAGGIFPTVTPVKFVDTVDYCIRGYGEFPLTDFIKGKDPKDIEGLCFRDTNNQIINNGICRKPKNLDELPFPNYDIVSLEPYHSPFFVKETDYPILSARGCVNHCSYCATQKKSHYHTYSCERVIEELRARPKGRDTILFSDATFNAQKERTLELCKKIKEADLGIIWACLARIDNIDNEILDAMYEAGCRDIMFGIETKSISLLKPLERSYNSDKAAQTVAYCTDKGFRVSTTFMYGLPGETRRQLWDTFIYALKMKSAIKIFAVLNLPWMLRRGSMSLIEKEFLEAKKNNEDTSRFLPNVPIYQIMIFAVFSTFVTSFISIFKNIKDRPKVDLKTPFSLKYMIKLFPSLIISIFVSISRAIKNKDFLKNMPTP